MNVALRKPMTMAEFLDWEERQDLRWEFDGFAPVAMTGGTLAHGLIQGNLIVALSTRLRGTPCRAVGSDVKINAAGTIRYPDAFVFCSRLPPRTLVVTDPVVVFEVLSPSSANIDHGVKNEEYRDTPSIQRYVMLEQDRQAATVFARVGGEWIGQIVSGDATLEMPEIGIEVPLAELYDGVPLSGADMDQDGNEAAP